MRNSWHLRQQMKSTLLSGEHGKIRLRLQVAAAVAVVTLLVGAPLLNSVHGRHAAEAVSQHAAATADWHGAKQ